MNIRLIIFDFDGTLGDTRHNIVLTMQQTMVELHLHVPAHEALVVGDMPVDIMMGRNAGTRTCAVTYGNASRQQLEAAGADFVIDDMDELIEPISRTQIVAY